MEQRLYWFFILIPIISPQDDMKNNRTYDSLIFLLHTVIYMVYCFDLMKHLLK